MSVKEEGWDAIAANLLPKVCPRCKDLLYLLIKGHHRGLRHLICRKCGFKFKLDKPSLINIPSDTLEGLYQYDPKNRRPMPNKIKFVPLKELGEQAKTSLVNETKVEIATQNASKKTGNLDYYTNQLETDMCPECKEKTLIKGKCRNPDCNYKESLHQIDS